MHLYKCHSYIIIMTNASVYVYDTLEEYMLFYPQGQDEVAESHLSSLWINNKNIVLVSDIRSGTAGYKPDFSKSLVYFDLGEKEFKKYEDNFEPIVEVEIEPKHNRVIFSGMEIQHTLAIARRVKSGELNNKKRHIKGYILYDDTRPRVNLIIKAVH